MATKWARSQSPADVRALARAVESAVFQSLMAASNGDEERWRAQADKLESKFTTEFDRHYSHFTGWQP